MKGLVYLPQPRDLQHASHDLQSNEIISGSSLALYFQWCRFDPRLAEMCTLYLTKAWKHLNPIELHFELIQQPWPEACGPILEQARMFLDKKEKPLFTAWKNTVMSGIPAVPLQNYWIGLYPLASKSVDHLLVASHKSYLNWGYLGNEWLINKSREKLQSGQISIPTQLKREQRMEILALLLNEKKSFTVEDYLEKLGFSASRRIAQLDLDRHPKIRSIGNTRNKRYR